jgi:hypothetical protein
MNPMSAAKLAGRPQQIGSGEYCDAEQCGDQRMKASRKAKVPTPSTGVIPDPRQIVLPFESQAPDTSALSVPAMIPGLIEVEGEKPSIPSGGAS